MKREKFYLTRQEVFNLAGIGDCNQSLMFYLREKDLVENIDYIKRGRYYYYSDHAVHVIKQRYEGTRVK